MSEEQSATEPDIVDVVRLKYLEDRARIAREYADKLYDLEKKYNYELTKAIREYNDTHPVSNNDTC